MATPKVSRVCSAFLVRVRVRVRFRVRARARARVRVRVRVGARARVRVRPSSTTSLAHSLLLGPACTFERISMFLLSVRETLTSEVLGVRVRVRAGARVTSTASSP